MNHEKTLSRSERQRLAQSLGAEKDSYYVYALCIDKVPFYIGKGKGERIYSHQDSAVIAKESIESDDTLSEDEKNKKIASLTKKLQAIQNNSIEHVVIKWGLTENEAFMCESSLINILKFIDGKKVTELYNLVNGHATKREKESVADIKTTARTLENFLEECAIQEKDVDTINLPIIYIKINNLYRKCKDENDDIDMNKVREATSGLWNIAQKHIDYFKDNLYVFALYNFRVVGIYKVNSVKKLKDILENDKYIFKDFFKSSFQERIIDHWACDFKSFSDAKNELSSRDYATFEEAFEKKVKESNKTKEDCLDDFRNKSCLELIEITSGDLSKFKNCRVVCTHDPQFFNKQGQVSSILYNFDSKYNLKNGNKIEK